MSFGLYRYRAIKTKIRQVQIQNARQDKCRFGNNDGAKDTIFHHSLIDFSTIKHYIRHMRENRFILSVCFLIILFCKIGSAQSLQVGVFNVNGVVYKVDNIANNTVTVVVPRDLVLQPDNPITVNGIPTEILIEGIIVNRDDGWFKYAKELFQLLELAN